MKKHRFIIAIIALATLLLVLNIWNESVNLYYAAGVYSMRQSWHTFFYNSLDSVGFITIDKPPLGLWIQTLFTWIFGFNHFSLLLPQILAAIGCIFLVFRLTEKYIGLLAANVATLVLAVTPIFIAVSRNNTQDSVMILFLMFATMCLFKAVQSKNPQRDLILLATFVGLAFNIKMLAAYMMVPAIYLTYFLFAKTPWKQRIVYTLFSGFLALFISFSWAVIVDLIPVDARPYVGGSETNSVLELIFGYNGLNRIFSVSFFATLPSKILTSIETVVKHSFLMPPPPPNGGGNIGVEAGTASLFRLLNVQMAGQISWFLIPSLFTIGLTFRQLLKGLNQPNHPTLFIKFYWSLNGLLMFAYFSFSSGLAHLYYLAEFAPVLAVLTGLAIEEVMRWQKKQPYAIALTIGVVGLGQLFIQIFHLDWFAWVFILVTLLMVFAVGVSVWSVKKNPKLNQTGLLAPLTVLLALPTIWAATPAMYGSNAQLPVAGPQLINGQNAFSSMPDYSNIIIYLEAQAGGATYFVCVPSSMELGNALILQSSGNVMVLGGFRGDDLPLTLVSFQSLISSNVVRLAVIPAQTQSTSEIIRWIKTTRVVIKTFGQVKVFDLTLAI